MDMSKWKLWEDDIAEKSSAPYPEYLTRLWPVNCSCRQLLWILSLKEHDKCLLRWRNNYAFLLFSYTNRSNDDIVGHQFQAESRLDETLVLDCAALWALIFQTVQLYERRYTRWIYILYNLTHTKKCVAIIIRFPTESNTTRCDILLCTVYRGENNTSENCWWRVMQRGILLNMRAAYSNSKDTGSNGTNKTI
jgi:hypothetical protein